MRKKAKWFDPGTGSTVDSDMDFELDAGPHGRVLLVENESRVDVFVLSPVSPLLARALFAVASLPMVPDHAEEYADEVETRLVRAEARGD